MNIPVIIIPLECEVRNVLKEKKYYGRKLIVDVSRLLRIVKFYQGRTSISYAVRRIILDAYKRIQERSESKTQLLVDDFEKVSNDLHHLLLIIRDLFHKPLNEDYDDDDYDELYYCNRLYHKKEILESWVSENEFEKLSNQMIRP